MDRDRVVLVDEQDNVVGHAGKLEAHQKGLLHRACSVVLFAPSGEMLLQRRSALKYHSAGRWSNTCCTHPLPGETPHQAATRRLQEEMGMVADLSSACSFVYRAHVGEGLTEYELDHVFVGESEAVPEPDPAEVSDWRWMNVEDVLADVKARPDAYTRWFPILLQHLHQASVRR